MAKIKFPLEMAEGVQVRSLDELKENFDIQKVIGYFLNGKLYTWLTDRYYEDLAEQVETLSKEDSELEKKLCKIFGVDYNEESKVDAEEIAKRNERIARLKQFTDDEDIIKNIDKVAFNQEELADLYDNGEEIIYLCEGDFNIPKSKQDLKYIELGGATVKGKKKEEKINTTTDVVYAYNEINVILPYNLFDFLGLESDAEYIITDNYNGKFIYQNNHKIFRISNGEKKEIMSSYNFNYQKIIGCDRFIIFNHMVGNNRGDHLKVYFTDIDVYEEIAKFVYEFIVNDGFIYYVEASDYSARSKRKIMRCKLDGSDKKELFDFGEISSNIFDLKIVGNKLYYNKKASGIMGSNAPISSEYIEIKN